MLRCVYGNDRRREQLDVLRGFVFLIDPLAAVGNEDWQFFHHELGLSEGGKSVKLKMTKLRKTSSCSRLLRCHIRSEARIAEERYECSTDENARGTFFHHSDLVILS